MHAKSVMYGMKIVPSIVLAVHALKSDRIKKLRQISIPGDNASVVVRVALLEGTAVVFGSKVEFIGEVDVNRKDAERIRKAIFSTAAQK